MLASNPQTFETLVFEGEHWYPVIVAALALIQRSTRALLLAISGVIALQSSTRFCFKRRTLRRSLQIQ